MGDTTLSDERRRILRRVKRHLVRDMDAEDVLLQMTAENVFNTTEEERIKVKLTRSEKNKQLLDILPSKGEKAYEIFKETLQEVHPHLANIILELEKKDLGSEEQAERARQSPDSKTSCIPQEIKNSIIHEFLVSEEGFTEDCPTLTHLDQTEGRSPVIFREIPQLNEEPPVCEPSTSVESPVDDSAQIGESRKSVVTQRLATLFKDEIGNCWKDLGIFLGVPECDLRNIEIDYDKVREKGGAVLQSWRDKKGSRATVGRLESVLIAMEKKRIAEKLLEIARKETCNSTEEEGVTGQHQASEREGSPEKMLSTAEEVYVPRTRHKKQSGRRDEGGSERRNTDELKRVAQLEKVRKSNLLKCKSKVEGETEQLQASERESSPETMPSTAEEVYVPRTRDIQQSGRRHEVESKRVESVEKVEEGSFKSKVDKLPKRQQNTRRNKPFEMLSCLLMEVAELKEVIEENILERIAENGNVEGLRGMIEKVRKVKQDFSGAS